MATADGAPAAAFGQLEFKLAYHDLLNNDQGFSRNSQVDFPNLTLRYGGTPGNSQDSLRVERLGIITVTSLFPMDPWEGQLSWTADLSYESPKDFGCENCHTVQLEGGGGPAISFFSDHLTLYSLFLAHTEAGSALTGYFRFGPELQIAALFQPAPRFKSLLLAQATGDLAQSARQAIFAEVQWRNSFSLSQNWELRGSAKDYVPTDRRKASNYGEFNFSLNRYF